MGCLVKATDLWGTKRARQRLLDNGGTREITMTRFVENLPVKTRLPVEAWALAGLVTLFSLVCSLIHIPLIDQAKPSIEQAIEVVKPPHQARV
jgi:hypothetical protein